MHGVSIDCWWSSLRTPNASRAGSEVREDDVPTLAHGFTETVFRRHRPDIDVQPCAPEDRPDEFDVSVSVFDEEHAY